MKYPGFVVFFNNRGKDWDYWYKMNNHYYNDYKFGMSNPVRLFYTNDTDQLADNRYFYGIGVSGRPDDEDFFLILPVSLDFTDGANYMKDSFLTYLYMMAFVKYCVKEESNTYYKPRYEPEKHSAKNIVLNKLEYHAHVKYPYPRLNNSGLENYPEDAYLSYDKDYDKLFVDKYESADVWDTVTTFYGNLTETIQKLNNLDFDEARGGEMFIDKSYNGALKPILNNIASMLDYKNGYFKLKEIVQDYNLEMRAEGKNKYGHVCHINNVCYDEI